MKMLSVRFFVAAVFLCAAAVAFANPFKSKIISSNDSVLEITVPGDHFMKITNFTQDGGTDRAVVEVTLPGDTENGGTTNVLTATRIDFSTGSNAQNSPEIGNRVTIAGPAIVRIRPIVGAKLFITYKKERDEGSGGGGGGGASPTADPDLQSYSRFNTCTDSNAYPVYLSNALRRLPASMRQSPSILQALISAWRRRRFLPSAPEMTCRESAALPAIAPEAKPAPLEKH